MGTASSQYDSSHTRKSSIFHFGNIQVITDKQNHSQFFEQIYDFMIGPDIESQSIQDLKERNNKSQYLVQIKKVELLRSSACSTANRLRVVFEYIPCTLQKLLDKNHNFNEKQIVRLLICLLEAVKYLNSNDSYHGDISPSFIYIDCKTNQQPVYKIFDSAYFQPIRNGYYRAQKQKIYCAPEVLMNLGEKRLYPIYNHFIADTFSIGLVVLYCMTLVDPLGAYTQKNQINSYFIESMFRIAYRKLYSEHVINIVRDCLQFRNRPSAEQVLETHELFLNSFRQTVHQSASGKTSLKRSRTQIPYKICHYQ